MTDQLETPTTVNPCPPWCAYGREHPGHGYECEGDHGEEIRYHSTDLTTFMVAGIESSGYGTYGGARLDIDIISEEAVVASATGVSVVGSQPAVSLQFDSDGFGVDFAWMTADEALALAGILTCAAAQLRQFQDSLPPHRA